MSYQTDLVEDLAEIAKIAREDDISETLISEIEETKEIVADFQVKVPLMGGFNAGKSSLLNSYLNNQKLPVDIQPETDIAAELKYGSTSRVVAHTKENETSEYKINQLGKIPADKYLYLEVFQNNSQLKQLEEIVLVDMPGLDSAVELHNKAIMNYVEEGVFYIILADVEQGLQGTVIDFLRELNLYELNFAVLLNKSDKKSESEVQEVVSTTQELVDNLTEKDIYVGSTSALTGEIESFKEILDCLEPDKLIEKNFREMVINLIEDVKKQLRMMIEFKSVDTSKLDAKIAKIKQQIAQIEEKIKREQKNIEHKFSGQTEDQILNKVRSGLENSINQLVQAAKVGQETFSNRVNQIIRPVLTRETKKQIEVVLETSFDNIGADLKKAFNIFEKIDLPNKSSSGRKLKDIDFNDQKLNGIFKSIIGGLGITTTVIAPWLEVIILFLPEILKLFGNLVNQDQQLKEKIKIEVIPRVIQKLRPKIQQALSETNEKFINQVSNKVEQEKDQLVEALNKVKEKKGMKKEEFAERQKKLESDLSRLENLKLKL